jgi:phage shock protein PspC (stress-responsive transcriptional regulator)
MKKIKKQHLLTVKEIAEKYNRKPAYIRFLVRTGAIPFFIVFGHIRFKPSDVDSIDYYFKEILNEGRGRKRVIKGVNNGLAQEGTIKATV